MDCKIKNSIKKPRWSPYWVGAGIGVLSWITFGLMGKALGVSTTLVRSAGALEKNLAETHVYSNEYIYIYAVLSLIEAWEADAKHFHKCAGMSVDATPPTLGSLK